MQAHQLYSNVPTSNIQSHYSNAQPQILTNKYHIDINNYANLPKNNDSANQYANLPRNTGLVNNASPLSRQGKPIYIHIFVLFLHFIYALGNYGSSVQANEYAQKQSSLPRTNMTTNSYSNNENVAYSNIQVYNRFYLLFSSLPNVYLGIFLT